MVFLRKPHLWVIVLCPYKGKKQIPQTYPFMEPKNLKANRRFFDFPNLPL